MFLMKERNNVRYGLENKEATRGFKEGKWKEKAGVTVRGSQLNLPHDATEANKYKLESDHDRLFQSCRPRVHDEPAASPHEWKYWGRRIHPCA
jgi:hypothetical protein